MEAFLYDSATEALASFQTRNAVFLAERLTASFPTEENWLLLATCYLRSKQTYRAYAVMKGAGLRAARMLERTAHSAPPPRLRGSRLPLPLRGGRAGAVQAGGD